MPQSAIIFLEASTTGTGALYVERAKDMGLHPILVTTKRAAYTFADKVEVIEIANSSRSAMERGVLMARTRHNVVAIWSSSDSQVGTAAALAAQFGLAHADHDAVLLCRDKLACRQTLKDAGLPTPFFALIRSADEAAKFSEAVRGPAIIKPRTGTGSMGVKLCTGPAEVSQHAHHLLVEAGDQGVLAEAYIDGPEFSVEIFDGKALGVTRKYLSAPPTFIEIGHDFPADLELDSAILLKHTAVSAITAVGLSRGPAHVELRLSGIHAYVIEINPRVAGGCIPELVRLSTGFDLIQAALEFCRNGTYVAPASNSRAAAVRFLLRRDYQSVVAISGLHHARNEPGIVEADVYKASLSRSGAVEDFRDRLAYVMADGATARDAAGAASKALAHLTPKVVSDLAIEESDTGLLRHSVSDEARAIVFGHAIDTKDIEVLQLMALVDSAHTIMLADTGIISNKLAQRVLLAIQELEDGDFAPLIGRAAPRGLYLLYEQQIIALAGPEAADAHLGRSRNDVNATIFALRVRATITELADCLIRLRRSLLLSAHKFRHVRMPMFSHRRPGMPSTWAHYLTGAERALSRDTRDLIASLCLLARCPMGAGAGAGTTLTINEELTAQLLGFDHGPEHSLDAVASRDAGARGLLAAALASSNISRIAADLLEWVADLEAVELPDQVVGSSSIMPQKRNPFLLEHIVGKAGLVIGDVAGCLSAVHSASFANSVAVGAESTHPILNGIATTRDAAVLLSLIVDGAKPVESKFADISRKGGVASTALALRLREQRHVSYRDAHHDVGKEIRALNGKIDLQVVAERVGVTDFPTDDDAVFVDGLVFGGGPASTATEEYRGRVSAQLDTDEHVIANYKERWARAENDLRARRHGFGKIDPSEVGNDA